MSSVSHMWWLWFLVAAFWVGTFFFFLFIFYVPCTHVWCTPMGTKARASACDHVDVTRRYQVSSFTTLHLTSSRQGHAQSLKLATSAGLVDSEFPGMPVWELSSLRLQECKAMPSSLHQGCESNPLLTEPSPQPCGTFFLVCLLRAPKPKVSSMQ